VLISSSFQSPCKAPEAGTPLKYHNLPALCHPARKVYGFAYNRAVNKIFLL
jgi:hypothetical protein